jgi:hypothetical protein
MQTFKEADQTAEFDKTVSHSERLRQAYFLISQACGFSMADLPGLDKSCYSGRRPGGLPSWIRNSQGDMDIRISRTKEIMQNLSKRFIHSDFRFMI